MGATPQLHTATPGRPADAFVTVEPAPSEAAGSIACQGVTVAPESLAYYAEPGRHTTLDEFLLSSSHIQEIVAVVQGLLIDDTVAKQFYEVGLAPEQADANLAELRHRYDNDDAVRMDGTVFNALRGQFETL